MTRSSPRGKMVKKPIREVAFDSKVKGVIHPTFTYMSNELVPGCNTYLEFTWIKSMPEPSLVVPRVHSHPYDQIELLIGSDPENPENLGAEVECHVGGKKFTVDKTNALFIPRGVEHGGVEWKRFDRPHMLVSITLGTGNFREANPGGRLPKLK